MVASLASLLATWALLAPRASGIGSGQLLLEQATVSREQRGYGPPQRRPSGKPRAAGRRPTGQPRAGDGQPQATANRSSYHIAWLISGQVSRFIYKDGAARLPKPLSKFVGCQRPASPADCHATLDVHIALANTHAKQFTGPKYRRGPTYEDGAYEEAVLRDRYTHLRVNVGASMAAKVEELKRTWTGGAKNVLVTIKSGEQFENEIKPLRARIIKQAAVDKNMSQWYWEKHFFKTIPLHGMRFVTNGNMMYLRHLAYSSALRFEKTRPYKYTHFLYTRDDNVFVNPAYTLIQLAKQLDGRSAKSPASAPAAVMVDSRCGWKSLSDKIYFATRSGFDVLFPRTVDDHVSLLTKWINRSPQAVNKLDPLQTEQFFQLLMEDARVKVTKYDFARTEARYITDRLTNDAKLCTPALYYNCTQHPVFEKCPNN